MTLALGLSLSLSLTLTLTLSPTSTFTSKPLSEYRSWAAASSSAAAVGTRLKFTDLRGQLHFGRPVRAGDRWPALRQLLRDDGSKLVCLYRRNFVKHAIGELSVSQSLPHS